MDTFASRRARTAVVVLLIPAAMFLLFGVFGGGQVSKILSTVGSSVTMPGTAGNAGGTGGSGSGGTGGSGSAGTISGSANGGQVADAGAVVPTIQIVRTGELELTVADLSAAVRDGDAAVSRAAGYVSGSSRTSSTGSESAVVTYRIPNAAWQPTVDALHALASKVVREQIKTEEVTGQVVDLTARITNLRATEAALQAIMVRAAKISDVLAVQEQLTTTRGEIEKLVGEKASLEDRASFGSLAVTFRLPAAPAPTVTPAPVKGWDPGDDVARASGKLVRIGQTTTSIGIWLAIVGLPIVIGAVVILAAVWQVYRVGLWVARRREAIVAGSR